MSSKRAVKAGCGGAGTIGCSTKQEGPTLIYLNQLILLAALNQKMRGEQVFFYKELIFFIACMARHLKPPTHLPTVVITFVLVSPIHGAGHPERKKSEIIFPAIPIFVPEHLGSATYPPSQDVCLDGREVTFPTAATTKGLLTLILPT
jgi:hypothetical protein